MRQNREVNLLTQSTQTGGDNKCRLRAAVSSGRRLSKGLGDGCTGGFSIAEHLGFILKMCLDRFARSTTPLTPALQMSWEL